MDLINTIVLYSQILSFDPSIALAVAKTESNFNVNAVGSKGEIGAFQIMPQFVSPEVKKHLHKTDVNVFVGIMKLKEAKDKCKHRVDLTWLTCYNVGITGANSIKDPYNFDYVKKVKKALANVHKYRNVRRFANNTRSEI